MADSNLQSFCDQLKRGPAFLYLGQNYLRLQSGDDPFLREVLRKYGDGDEKRSYFDLFDSRLSESPESAIAWMEERCRRLSPPEWLKLVASFAWNGVYTSAIDSIWPSVFRNPWREVQPIFEESYKPRDPRNRSLLHCTFLFGCVNRTDAGYRPPLRRSEWRHQRQIAVSLARRLTELVTPLGTLVVEAHGGQRDWYEIEELLPIFGAFGNRQVHVFSASESFDSNAEIRELVNDGKVILHSESLAQLLSEASELGYLTLGLRPDDEQRGRRIRVEDKYIAVPRDLWNTVSRTAAILDDATIASAPPISEEALYREFREALSRTEGRPNWTAYSRNLYFTRHYESKLRAEIERQLSAKEISDLPIILHGPTGTGKTVASAALAYSVRKAGKYPVLFIERRTQKTNISDVEQFCRWAEEQGAKACLLVWDGMLDLDEYSRSLRQLTSKGRKVVLIGTAYTFPSQYTKSSRFIEAPQRLVESERDEFGKYLKRFHPALDKFVGRAPDVLRQNFLVTLYRLLPPTRSAIRTGVAKEISYAENLIMERASQPSAEPAFPSALAKALFKAGVVSENEFFSSTENIAGDENLTNVQNLTGLIMIPGQFGIRVPLELLLRGLKYGHTASLAKLLEDIDIFFWYEDAVGNIEIGPRNQLEARLIVQARLGGTLSEIGFAKRLLSEVREGAVSGDREIDFAVDLLLALRGKRQTFSAYSDHFRELAETLTDIRDNRGIENPRLMLQEANLLREWVIARSKSGFPAPDDRQLLDRAEDVLHRAIELVGDDPRRKDIRGYLMVELGSTLATKARTSLNRQGQAREVVSSFESMRKVLLSARTLNQYNYYPIDVLAWATRDVLSSTVLTKTERAEAIADMLYTFQTAPKDEFDPEQVENFDKRRLEFAQFVGEEALAQDAFDALVAQGSAAGFFIRALHLSGLPDSAPLGAQWDNLRLRRALEYLEENRSKVSQDARCLDLLLDLWWMVKTKNRFFASERTAPPLGPDDWQYLLNVVDQLSLTGESYRPLVLTFLRGLSLFHLRQYDASIEAFREVDRESETMWGKQRIIRSYIASQKSGQPQVFHGTAAWVTPDGARAEVYVEEIMRRVPFFPREFGQPNIRKGETLGEFHIAFNFLGPVADSKAYLRKERG